MDIDQYKDAFLSDAALAMSKVRLALAALMKDPGDEHALFDVMRIFHSLKSSAAMMQYKPLSDAAADQETLYTQIIDAKGRAPAEDIAGTLRIVDGIEAALMEIKRGEGCPQI